jgi:flagellar protein FliO/FliZ
LKSFSYAFLNQVSLGVAGMATGFSPAVAMAAEKADATSRAAGLQPMAADNLLQTGLGLFMVLALIMAVAWVARRMGRFQRGTGNSLRIIGGLSMGTRERVVLIQAGDTQLLVGVAPGRVQTLHVLSEAVSEPAADTAQQRTFATSLSSLLKRRQTA